MKIAGGIAVLIVLLAGATFFVFFNGDLSDISLNNPPTPAETEEEGISPAVLAAISGKANLISVNTLNPGDTITSPVEIKGQARGYWFFEASFPVVLVDWNGKIIAQGVAQAEGDWMTEEMVPFTVSISYKSPYITGDPPFMSKGAIILQKDNPSGLPENDDALEIPVTYASDAKPSPFAITIPHDVTIYDGITYKSNEEEVDLSGRGLTGSLKAEIRELTKLKVLNLSDNQFTGLPAEVGQLSELEVLDLSGNPLTGLPYELGNLANLKVLDLRGTQYSHADLEVIMATLSTSSTQVLTDDDDAESEEDGEVISE